MQDIALAAARVAQQMETKRLVQQLVSADLIMAAKVSALGCYSGLLDLRLYLF